MTTKGFGYERAKTDKEKFDKNFEGICTCMFNNCRIHLKESVPAPEEESEETSSSAPSNYLLQ